MESNSTLLGVELGLEFTRGIFKLAALGFCDGRLLFFHSGSPFTSGFFVVCKLLFSVGKIDRLLIELRRIILIGTMKLIFSWYHIF